MTTFGAKTALKALQPLNTYDRHRTHCTCDERKTASMISGHTWNIINHSDKDEVYLTHARNNDHYIDEQGVNLSHWFEKKKRIDLDGDGVIECLDSSNVQEAMFCQPDTDKETRYLQERQSKQLRQSEHPTDYGQYNARRIRDGVRTPERGGNLAVTMQHQNRLRDVHVQPSPRVVSKSQWTPRRSERLQERSPPPEHDMFRNVHQMRTDSHMDTSEANFADAVHSARAKSFAQAAKSTLSTSSRGAEKSVLFDLGTSRSTMGKDHEHLPPKPGAERRLHSQNRMERLEAKHITAWHMENQESLKRGDPFYARPVQNTGSSSVKYDIISNERHPFWY